MENPIHRVRTIGQGGLGIVSLYQGNDGCLYAVKQMKYVWDDTLYMRFKREIQIMANLFHKNIVKVLNSDVIDQNPWYVMPFYKDGSLRDKILNLQSEGQVYTVNGAAAIIYYLADALNHAHRSNIIHRDLKPENILFNGTEPMIADWGIGKFIHKSSDVLTVAGLGTKTYCAPEQWDSGKADHRSDIFSLGIIFRELLTGSTHGQVLDGSVNSIINKMTLISPSDRYQSMQEVLHAINSLGIVNLADPMKDFWGNAGKVAVGVGLVYLLAKIFEG
jgi:serine/threonine protein kinase